MGKNAGGVLGDVLGVGAGAAGFVRGMTLKAADQRQAAFDKKYRSGGPP